MKKIYFIPIFYFVCFSLWSQCPATVTISGVYATTYTGSNSWIASSGVTTIPTASNVTLDANPANNGYVLLDTGFETQPNAVFSAVVVTPCALLSINQNTITADFTIFPNPIKDVLNIKSEIVILKTEIYDVNGKLIFDKIQNQENVILNVDSFPVGIYLLKVSTEQSSKIIKICKQ
ncbi:MAG: T9SS type A sorting domain-containing protein [Flavobacterium sp.]|nr:T9SS type A sorting domain-containing protein [Flavobacterium sp.]